ncbi:hypothetical protein, partial [Methyloceanibacter sp.]|uniref:hypothetical protein n=1 Tax=Methyloceanibacter sp. TaxID=1965321 RepID=UPI002D5D1432
MTTTRARWNGWQLDKKHRVLIYPKYAYEIDLEGCTTSASILDWIFQLAGKGWATSRVLAGFVHAVDDILDPQTRLCTCCLGGG